MRNIGQKSPWRNGKKTNSKPSFSSRRHCRKYGRRRNKSHQNRVAHFITYLEFYYFSLSSPSARFQVSLLLWAPGAAISHIGPSRWSLEVVTNTSALAVLVEWSMLKHVKSGTKKDYWVAGALLIHEWSCILILACWNWWLCHAPRSRDSPHNKTSNHLMWSPCWVNRESRFWHTSTAVQGLLMWLQFVHFGNSSMNWTDQIGFARPSVSAHIRTIHGNSTSMSFGSTSAHVCFSLATAETFSPAIIDISELKLWSSLRC